jgi:VanZ family protein
LAYWAFAVVVAHLPVTGLNQPQIKNADKMVHVGLYFGLTCLGAVAVARRADGTYSASRIWGWALLYVAYAALDEWLQQFVSRTPSLWDWVADSIGVLLGSLWFSRSAQWKA